MANNFWERNAQNWAQAIQSQAIPSRLITNAAILRTVEKYRPQSILDIGCGEGFMGPLLTAQGLQYEGIDGSAGLIDIARSSHPQQSFQHVTYEQISSGHWKFHRPVDAVLFNFSLLDEDISFLLQASAGFLDASGYLFIQTLHPCFVLADYCDGYRREDFKTMQQSFEGEMPWFGRTLQSWSQVFAENLLRIVEIVEPMGEKVPLSMIFVLQPGHSTNR